MAKGSYDVSLSMDDIKKMNKDFVSYNSSTKLLLADDQLDNHNFMHMYGLNKKNKNVKSLGEIKIDHNLKKNILSLNYNKRMEEIKSSSDSYKRKLIRSINFKLKPHIKTQYKGKNNAFSQDVSQNKKENDDDELKHIERIQSARKLTINPILNERQKTLFGKRATIKYLLRSHKNGIDSIKNDIDTFFIENPLNEMNFYKAQIIDKEIDCLMKSLLDKRNNEQNDDAIISIFEKKHKELKRKIFKDKIVDLNYQKLTNISKYFLTDI